MRNMPAISQRTGTPPEPTPTMPSSVCTSATWMRAEVVGSGCQVGEKVLGIGISNRRTLTWVIFIADSWKLAQGGSHAS